MSTVTAQPFSASSGFQECIRDIHEFEQAPLKEKRIFIMAGEASGDLHGSMLVNSLKKLDDKLIFFGVGGIKLEQEGTALLYNYSQFSSMGFLQPVFKLWFYRNMLKKIPSFIIDNGIDTTILIDYPGFNLLLAERLKRNGIRVIYYISPQIWAWHYSRIEKIKRYVDAIIVIYPFEEKMYRDEGIRSFFVGNPLIDIVSDGVRKGKAINFRTKPPCIGLLPGSRVSEVKRHLQPMLQAAGMLGRRYKGSFVLPTLKGDVLELIEKELKKSAFKEIDIHLVVDNTYKAIETADILIISSGTATLEAAILKKPMVIVYRVDFITEILARILIRKIDNISLINILSGDRVCPELLQRDVNAKKIYKEVCKILNNKVLYDNTIEKISLARNELGQEGSIERIARVVLSLIYE